MSLSLLLLRRLLRGKVDLRAVVFAERIDQSVVGGQLVSVVACLSRNECGA